MAPRFNPHLVNDPFGDPGLLMELMFDRRALLFDLGDLSPLPPRKLLRIGDIFVTHRHMDHFSGFDHLLRFVLGRDQVLNLYGPAGLIEAVGHKLSAYTWNLLAGYGANLRLRAHELDAGGRLTMVEYQGLNGFRGSQPADAQHAAARHHLTAHQAGTLARQAQAKRIVTLHYSPRYEGRGDELHREALAAFRSPA